ncbi:MAG: hypothetical protein E7160_01690 [Firmicutes bacterium]|nr:hypothetical protein [Bacillota bacterium]
MNNDIEEIELLDDYNEQKPEKEIKPNNQNNNPKYFMVIIIFGIVLASTIFLPEISNFIKEKTNNSQLTEEKITSGTLICKLDKSNEKFDYSYLSEFSFENSKLLTFSYTTTTTGDKKDLYDLKEKCELLKSSTKELSGINIDCNLGKKDFIERQLFTYISIDEKELSAAYSEAGGIYPNFSKNENIDDIERNMNASNYKCSREK